MVLTVRHVFAAILIMILGCAGLFILAVFWFGDGHGASLSYLRKVQPGMTKTQVIAILGHPGTINHSSVGSESWYYSWGTLCQVKVHLTTAGLVDETEHDH